MPKRKRLVEYFISVGIDDSVAPINDDIMSNPIRALQIVSDKEDIPDGFDVISSTVSGREAPLAKKGFMNQTKYYLCYSREANEDPFSLIHYTEVKLVEKQWRKIPGRIVKNQNEYCLCVKNDADMAPIVDICLISTEAKEECPPNYLKMNWNINGLTICCRHMPTDALELRYQTCIIDRFPFRDYSNSPLSNTTAVFCQPNGAQILEKIFMPTFLSFVLTDSEGEKMYAVTVTFCDEMNKEMLDKVKRSTESIYTGGFRPIFPENIKTLYYTRSVCILSYFPFYQSFRECLKELYRLACSPGDIPIERYIINLCCETPIPIANKMEVKLQYAHKPIIFRLPGDNECPLLDLDLQKLFSCLDIGNVITLFRALITQDYKVVISSSHISLITSVMESLSSFLMPFEWQFTYVPVLPYSVFGILEAPLSVFVGLHSSRLRPEFYHDDRETVIADLDNNIVRIPQTVSLIEFPPNLQKYLRHNLKHMANCHKVEKYDHNNRQLIGNAFAARLKDDEELFDPYACRLCFLLFWSKLMGMHYRDYLVFPDDTEITCVEDLFQIHDFVESRPKNQRKFWQQFSASQGFERFVADETLPSQDARKYQLYFFLSLAKKHCEIEDNANLTATKQQKLTQQKLLQDDSTRDIINWARDQIPELEKFKVPPVNKENLPDDYKYEPTDTFPSINSKYCDGYNEIDKKENENSNNENGNDPNKNHLTVDSAFDKPAAGSDLQLISRFSKSSKIQTDKDKATFMLTQIYGCWFNAHVASLDFKDFSASEVDRTVKNTLDVLYKMPDNAKITKDIALQPDELIYKACLVLCGKFGKVSETKRIFRSLKASGINPSKTTYGAYTNALASSGANALLSSLGSESSGHSSRLPSFDHRRSFVPSFAQNSSNTIQKRSFDATSTTSQRLMHKNVGTIHENEEHNDEKPKINSADVSIDVDEINTPPTIQHSQSVPVPQHLSLKNQRSSSKKKRKFKT